MAANAITIPGAEEIEFYFSNGTYADAQVMPILKGKVANELGKLFIKDGVGNLCKLMCDASGSSNTPASRVFFSDSDGAASSDSVLIYDSINKKLGIGVSPAIGAKLHLHQASTANALIKLSNTTTGSDEHDGLNIGVVGDSYVVRTQYNRPIVIETENPNEPGQYLEIAKFQKTGSVSNTILNSNLKVNTILAKSKAASVFLTHEENTIKTRTASQVLDDIGAAAVSHTQAISTVSGLQNALDSKQPLDTDLTAIAALTHSNRHVMISNGSAWTRRALVADDLPNISAAKITSGTLSNDRLSFNPDYFVQGINSRRSVILGSASPLDSNKHSTFFTMYASDPTYDSRLSGHGIGFRSQHGENDDYALDMIGNTSGDGTLLFGGVYNNVRQPWRAIWHEGNFNPADYQPAITGTGNKVLSIQADGTGVKTGSIYDDGNVALIGKTTATGGYSLEVEGNQLVNGNSLLEGYLIFAGENKRITTNTATTDKNSSIALGYPNAANSGFVAVYENNNAARQGDVVLQAGGATGKILLNGDTYNNGNTAFGKNTFVGGYTVEVEGNTLVNGNETITGDIDVGGNLQTRNNISLLNKAGNAWLIFVTRDVSGSEAVADLSNVRSITPAGSALNVKGNLFLWNKLQMINRNGDAWDVIDRETGGNGIGARLKNITMLNDMSVTNGVLSRSGNIGISGHRVVMSRRNVGGSATINITTNPQIIDLNSYEGISRFYITTSMVDGPVVYFKNATEGDEIFLKIVSTGQYPSEYDILLGWNIDRDETWMRYATKRYFHLICEGTATAGGVTANKWWVAGVHGLFSP